MFRASSQNISGDFLLKLKFKPSAGLKSWQTRLESLSAYLRGACPAGGSPKAVARRKGGGVGSRLLRYHQSRITGAVIGVVDGERKRSLPANCSHAHRGP